MTVEELNELQKNELKEALICEDGQAHSYEELIHAHSMNDSIIFTHYAGIEFDEEDSFLKS